MTSITIVWDSEDVSKECLKNWIEALIEKQLISAGFVSKILINNKEVMNREEISRIREFHDKIELQAIRNILKIKE